MGLDRKVGEGTQGVKRNVYKRASVSSTRLRQKNENGSWYIGLYNGKSVINRVWR